MDLSQLQRISDLKFQRSEQDLVKLRLKEASLRTELNRLKELRYETHSLPPEDAQMRAIGGDIIWLQWLASNQRRLNIELAQVLAQKEALVTRHRVANGKKIVTDALNDRQTEAAQKERAKASLRNAIEASLVNKGQ